MLNTLTTTAMPIDWIAQITGVVLSWGWLFIFFLAMWVAWETYRFIKHVDYVSGITWTYLQITVPEDAEQTPKAMENAYEVWGGIHKDPDIVERFFEGYQLAWYSCELQCQQGRIRYIMVVPTAHAKFFEGVIYGQYPTAVIKEVEDYTQEFSYRDIEKKFDLYGTEIVLVEDDIFPIRTYKEFVDIMAEETKYVDPHQSLLEAYSNVGEGEQFWVQFLIRPVDASVINAWSKKGYEKIKEISGEKKEKPKTMLAKILDFFTAIPIELLALFANGTLPEDSKKDEKKVRYTINPLEDALMKGILQKVTRAGFKTMIRLIYIAPPGRLNKPNISKAIGAFKQFNSFHLNSLKPDPATKTNGPNYIMKQTRRAYRKRSVLVNYQWRDFWGDSSGQMFSAEELATLYHFPMKYIKAPAIQHAASGMGSPPENLPYA